MLRDQIAILGAGDIDINPTKTRRLGKYIRPCIRNLKFVTIYGRFIHV